MAKSSKPKTASNLALGAIERVILYVKDTERAAHFYSKTLGIPIKVQEKGWVELGTKGTTLCLHGGRTAKSSKTECSTVSFCVDDFDAAYRALKIREVSMGEPESPCEGLRYAEFTDPDGNILSIEGK